MRLKLPVPRRNGRNYSCGFSNMILRTAQLSEPKNVLTEPPKFGHTAFWRNVGISIAMIRVAWIGVRWLTNL